MSAKPENSKNKTHNSGKLKRRRKRELSPNAIQIENTENGKATTALPTSKDDESIQIINGNINGIDSNKYLVFDGPLDPQSNYTGFVEVIGKS